MASCYSDERVFRTGTGAETLEVAHYGKSILLSIDSHDAPEQIIRIDAEVATALADWLRKAVAP